MSYDYNRFSPYDYPSGPPAESIRSSNWEGFAEPSSKTRSFIKKSTDNVDTSTNNRVLWVIADTYGNSNEIDPNWRNFSSWFFDEDRVRFIEPKGTPHIPQNWHGFACYSRGWPLLFHLDNVDVVLFRMIDVPNGQNLLLDFIEDELKKYKGRVVLSNSWGVPRRNNDEDLLIEHKWSPWVNRLSALIESNQSFVVVFSSGNQGPLFSGSPQSVLTNAFIVGASSKYGKIAKFSSQNRNMFCVAGGESVYVADPKKAGSYNLVNGTSFSCPTVSAMFVKLLAEHDSYDRYLSRDFLISKIVPSFISNGHNSVWGLGELEQYNQTVEYSVWRQLNYPNGFLANIKSFFLQSTFVDLPTPLY